MSNYLNSLKSFNKLNLFYTFIILLGNFCYGNIGGVAMVDLIKVYGIDMAVFSQMSLGGAIGAMLGSLIGMLYKWISRQLCISVSTLVMAIATICTPFLSSPLWLAYGGQAVIGFGTMVWWSGVNIWLVEMWPEASGSLLQTGQFMYGLGSVMTPIMASTFLYGEANVTEDNRTLTVELRRNYLAVPYAITGGLQAVAPLLILILFFVARYKTTRIEENVKEINTKSSVECETSNKIPYRKVKLALCGMCMALYISTEVGYFPYCSPMWQYMDIRLSASEAASVASIFSIAYTLSPIITAFIAMKVQSDIIISYHFVLILSAVVVLYFGRMNKVLIYIGNIVLGYGFAPMIPALIAFAERHLKLDDRICSFFYFCTNFVSMAMPLILGRFLEKYPFILLYLLASVTTASLILFVILRLWLFLGK